MIKRILVRCPSTAKLMPTGKTVEEESWEATKVKANSKIACPHCQGTHAWTKKDVVLAR